MRFHFSPLAALAVTRKPTEWASSLLNAPTGHVNKVKWSVTGIGVVNRPPIHCTLYITSSPSSTSSPLLYPATLDHHAFSSISRTTYAYGVPARPLEPSP